MITVVKIGGHVLDDERQLKDFCRDFAALPGPKALVHGGSALATKVLEALGIPSVKVEGRRVTDASTLQVVTMVYAGWYNKQLTATLQGLGCNAIGLSGCDASCVTAGIRPPRTLADGKTQMDYGFVGDVRPSSFDAGFIGSLLEKGLVPVFSAINHDGHGQLLNTNADTMASCLAAALGARLLCCFEQKGVLMDINDPDSVIPVVDSASFSELKAAGTISAGMLPKLGNAFSALRAGASEVIIKSASGLLGDGGTKVIL